VASITKAMEAQVSHVAEKDALLQSDRITKTESIQMKLLESFQSCSQSQQELVRGVFDVNKVS
jgi:hypothetical protein